MKKAILIILTLISVPLWAQNVQWSFKILDFSTEKSSKEYSSKQALGLPNAMPSGLENIKAWEPKGNRDEEFIKVGFLTPIKAKQIVIVESFHPGSITKILVYDAEGKEQEVASYVPKATSAKSRILSINISGLDYFVFAVKVVLKGDKDLKVGIDAIGISESDKAFKIKTNANDLMKANMVAVKLDTNVNSKYIEMGPLVSPNGKTMYFSRRNDPADMGGKNDEEDIWYSEWDEKRQNWGLAKNMGAPLNNKEANFINSISPDGNTILLGNSYLPDGTMEDGVSTSRRTINGWGTPERLIIEDDQKNKSLKANYFMSNSQKILLISNDRKGDSYGDRDLYVSFLKMDSTWTKPLNLGKNINTKGIEAAPFLAADDKTLYFTSDGWMGYGGSDIYISRRLDESWTKWSEPENLGPVVNSSNDESFFTLSASGEKVYFTSQAEKNDDLDMFMLKLPSAFKPKPVMLVKGRVINTKTNTFIPDVKIFFENLTTGKEVGIASSNPTNGNFEIILPSGDNYGYLAEKSGFVSVNSNLDLTALDKYKEEEHDIFLTPIEVGQTIVLHNIFFDFDKALLKKESFLELNRLSKLLIKNGNLKIEVSAFTDNVGTEVYNDNLSRERAKSVLEYLIGRSGADKDRISLKHYGETSPVASNKTASGRKLNRRVQFKILAQ